jgi:hypothetical protein
MSGETVLVQGNDEALHAPENDPLWSESFYLNFSDSEGRFGGFTRMALHPTMRETEGLLCLYLPGGRVGTTLLKDAREQPIAGTIRAKSLSHTCVRPLEEWRIQYDGDVHVFEDPALIARVLEPNANTGSLERIKLDLEITGIHPPFFYPNYRRVAAGPLSGKPEVIGVGRKLRRALRRPAEIRQALRMRTARHYEQSMTVRGSVTLNGRTETFKGTGHRDHSWGLRDWSVSHRFRWLTGQMDGLAFNAMYMTVAGSHVTNGYLWNGSRCSPMDELKFENSFDQTGLAARKLSLELSSGGERFVITGDVMLNVPLPIIGPGFSTMYTIGRTHYSCGSKTGYGVAEFLERLYP